MRALYNERRKAGRAQKGRREKFLKNKIVWEYSLNKARVANMYNTYVSIYIRQREREKEEERER